MHTERVKPKTIWTLGTKYVNKYKWDIAIQNVPFLKLTELVLTEKTRGIDCCYHIIMFLRTIFSFVQIYLKHTNDVKAHRFQRHK